MRVAFDAARKQAASDIALMNAAKVTR